MRILLISPFFYPHIGGSQRYMEELYASMIRQEPSLKVDVLCYNTENSPKREVYKNMTIHRVDCLQILPGQFVIPNPLQLAGTLISRARVQYDVVHANTRFFESTWWAWIFAKMIHAKSILTDHVSDHPLHPNKTVRFIAKIVDYTIASWSLRQYDMVTATNAKTVKFLQNMLHIPHVKLSYGGIDTKFFIPNTRVKKRVPHVSKRFSKSSIIITFAGRLIKTKAPMLFLRAIAHIQQRLSTQVHIVIAGDGPLQSELRSQASLLRIANRVHFTGRLNQTEMKRLLQSTDIFVHPSVHAEGFPNAILEAGSSGCFVIATNNAGTSEIIQHKQNGLLIPQNNIASLERAILWALTHPKERNHMATEARNSIQQLFDWKRIGHELFIGMKQLFMFQYLARGHAVN